MATRNQANRAVQKRLLEGMTYELIPLKNLADQSQHLPAGATVSVTCSPAKTDAVSYTHLTLPTKA